MRITEFYQPFLNSGLFPKESNHSRFNENLIRMDYLYSHSGVLIWHILENRIFMSEGFCRMMGISKSTVQKLEVLFLTDTGCEFRHHLRNILDQVCNNEVDATNFKTTIPGIDKEICGSVQLFDDEERGILDLLVIFWKV